MLKYVVMSLIQYDHAKFGKENQYSFAGPKQSDKEPVKSTVHIHMPQVAPDSATYSMHSDTEPQYSQGKLKFF